MITSYRLYVLMMMERAEYQATTKRMGLKLAVNYVLRGRFVGLVYTKRDAIKVCRKRNRVPNNEYVTFWKPEVINDWKLEEI